MTEIKFPTNLKYTKQHQWVKIINSNAIIGITDFAQKQLTDIVFVELPEIGKEVKQNGNLCTIESVKSVSDIKAPLSGEVIEVNKELENKPELINKDPYGEGWIVKIKVKDESEMDKLLSAEEYKKIASEN